MRILIASPVRQKPQILREFLAGLEGLETARLSIGYSFVDDNTDNESRTMLRDWHGKVPKDVIIQPGSKNYDYACGEDTHHWTDNLVQRVARFKNGFIHEAINCGYDHIFLVDSDIVLHPRTLTHLVNLNKDIVSEVFWTRWHPGEAPGPNVWQTGNYTMTKGFLEQLRRPGAYPVGGLGACTLISRRALEAGVSFSPLPNLDYTGEDRHFCVRAAALGLELWADTHYPPYHIYRESELPGLALWRDRQRERGSRITMGMLVRNEAGRYLEQVLEQAKKIADNIVILDDASTDGTVAVCRDAIQGYAWSVILSTVKHLPNVDKGYLAPGCRVLCNKTHSFHNEIELRQQLWDEIVSEAGTDWVLILDADELLEPRAIDEIRRLAADPEAEAYSFRLFDMWDADHYRDDAFWNAHKRPWAMMVRYIPGMEYHWREQALHCGRFPVNVLDGLNIKDSGLRIKHMGYARPEDRQEKAERYARLDPEAKYGVKAQYDSILDPSPNLRPWAEEEKPPTISLCMIVRDEEQNLPRCLESVKGAVDEIVVVDTGSTDHTVCKVRSISGPHQQFSSKYISFAWTDNFAEARNVSLDHATSDWILILDADEELVDPAALRRLVQDAPDEIEGYFLRLVSEVGDGSRTCEDAVLRLFRNRPEYRFEGAAHEQIADSIRRHTGREPFAWATDQMTILHHGFTDEARARKAGRNLKIMEADPPKDGESLRLYQHGMELMDAGRWEDAVTQFCRSAQGIDPRQIYLPKMVRSLVISLINAGKQERALAVALVGARLWPNYADLWHYAGEIYFRERRIYEAHRCYEKVVGAPDQPVHYNSAPGIRESAKTALDSLPGTDNPAEMTDWELLSLLLTTLADPGPMDVDVTVSGGRKKFVVSAEELGRIVEGRGE